MENKQSGLDAIYNDGERLVPGETHNRDEVIRHKSSYEFFYRIIESDIINNPLMLSREIKILDIGSGTGHGTFMLSKLPGVKVTGLEIGVDALAYARKNYAADNLEYINYDLNDYINMCEKFDYVVSRHALEHIIDGLNMALKIPFSMRLIVNVPFNEDDTNPFHLVHWINEGNFENYRNREFFYESMEGETSLTRNIDHPPNSIVGVSSVDGLRKIGDMFVFPFPAWRPEFLQERGLGVIGSGIEERVAELESRESLFALLVSETEETFKSHENEIKRLDEALKIREEALKSRAEAVESRISAFNSSKSVKFLRMLKLFH